MCLLLVSIFHNLQKVNTIMTMRILPCISYNIFHVSSHKRNVNSLMFGRDLFGEVHDHILSKNANINPHKH